VDGADRRRVDAARPRSALKPIACRAARARRKLRCTERNSAGPRPWRKSRNGERRRSGAQRRAANSYTPARPEADDCLSEKTQTSILRRGAPSARSCERCR